jgi:redox-sensitive bicupin YhaK (pirin superfamily)
MSAGSGMFHTEGNSSTEKTRYLQIWIRPHTLNTSPHYEHVFISREEKLNTLVDITVKLPILQDARFYTGILTQEYTHSPQSRWYLYVITGTVECNGTMLFQGDGASGNEVLHFTHCDCELILFEVK